MRQEIYDKLIDSIITLTKIVQVLVNKVGKLEEKEREKDAAE